MVILSQILKAADAETWRSVFAVNAPNAITIAAINFNKVQAVATLTLTFLSILSTGVILWLNFRKLNKKKGDNE